MTLYKKREKFGTLSVKVGIVFSKFGLSPNQWTLLTLIPALLSFYFLINENFLLATVSFVFVSFMDLIDGSVARVTGRVTRLGAYIDTIVDRYVEGIVIFGLFFASLPNVQLPYVPAGITTGVWLFAYLFGSMMTTYSKAAAKEKNIFKEKELRGGILERPERLIILLLGIFSAHFDPFYLSVVIIILAILTNVSSLHRIMIAYSESRKEN